MPNKVRTVMREFQAGTLHSGSKTGPKVTSRDQAIAIALSEQRKRGGLSGLRPYSKTRKRRGTVGFVDEVNDYS